MIPDPWTDAEIAELIRLEKAEVKPKDRRVAFPHRSGASVDVKASQLRARGLLPPTKRHGGRGISVPVEKVMALRKQGVSTCQIAKRLSLAISTVRSAIIRAEAR